MKTMRAISIFILSIFLASCETGMNDTETADLPEGNSFELNEKRKKKLVDFEAHFSFDNSNNLGEDKLAQNNITNNGVKYSARGLNNGAAYFDGTSYFKAAESRVRKGFFHHKIKYRTYMLWIQPENITEEQIIIDEGGGVNSFALRIINQKLEAAIMTRGVKRRKILSVDFNSAHIWSHVAAVFNRGKFSLYINGNLVAETRTRFKKVRRHPNGGAIGSQYGRNAFTGRSEKQAIKRFYRGFMDDLKIYNIALSPETIKTEYDSNKPGSGGGGPR